MHLPTHPIDTYQPSLLIQLTSHPIEHPIAGVVTNTYRSIYRTNVQFDHEIDTFLRAEGLANTTNDSDGNGRGGSHGGSSSSSSGSSRESSSDGSGSGSGSGSSSGGSSSGSSRESSSDGSGSGSGSSSGVGGGTVLPPRRIVLSGLPQTLLPYLYSLAHALVIPSHGEGMNRRPPPRLCHLIYTPPPRLCHSYIPSTPPTPTPLCNNMPLPLPLPRIIRCFPLCLCPTLCPYRHLSMSPFISPCLSVYYPLSPSPCHLPQHLFLSFILSFIPVLIVNSSCHFSLSLISFTSSRMGSTPRGIHGLRHSSHRHPLVRSHSLSDRRQRVSAVD